MARTPHPPSVSRPSGTIQAKPAAGMRGRHEPPPVTWAGSPLHHATAAQPKAAAPSAGPRFPNASPPAHRAGTPFPPGGAAQPKAMPARAASDGRHMPPPPVHWPGGGGAAGGALQGKTVAPAAMVRHAAGLPGAAARTAPMPGHPPSMLPGPPARGVIQASRMSISDDEDDDADDESSESDGSDGEYVPDHLRKKKKVPRHAYLAGTRERVTLTTAHEKKYFNRTKYNAVYTCRVCGRPIAYYDKSNNFQENGYAYISKEKKNQHDTTALAMDHYPPWAGRYHQHVKNKSSQEAMRRDFQDETKLRALCKVCNERHFLEHSDLPDDYDSDSDGRRDPGTPKNEPLNKGRWSGFWDPGKGGGGIKI